MAKTSMIQLCRSVNEWFHELDTEERETVLKLIAEGYEDILEWLEEKHPQIWDTYSELQDRIHESLKETTKKQVEATLRRSKLLDILAQAMVRVAFLTLRIYRDSKPLREMTPDEFSRVVNLIMIDNYVERRFLSWTYCSEYIGLTDLEEVKQCYRAIMNLVRQHYGQLSTLEELGEFMVSELAFQTLHVECFFQLLLKYREQIDRYMILNKLAQLERRLQG